jgi:alpha-galactosidase
MTPTVIGLLSAAVTAQAASLSVPFYGTSANGFTSPPRGWNSFGLQALGGGQFTLNQSWVQQQCDLLNATAGYTLCSIDSGWSGNGGDPLGRLVPEPSLFPDLSGLADHLHSQGKLLGIYILPGALSSDANVTVEGTNNIQLGTLFDPTQPSYNLRQTFDYRKDGVQQWHNSVVNNFVQMLVLVSLASAARDH